MSPAPGLEPSRDSLKQLSFWRRDLLGRRAAKEAGAERRVPADVMALPHLAFEEPGEEEAVRARRLHHVSVVVPGRVDYKSIEHLHECRRRGDVTGGLRRN